MSTIYEDVAALQEQMTSVLSTLENMKVSEIEADTDLNNLAVGNYYVPNSAVSGTLLNKPTTSTATAFIKVVEGGADGQKTMYYCPCNKTNPSFYHRAFYQNSWGEWNEINHSDTGWIDLPLMNGAVAYSEAQKPRYRRIGKEVFLSGVFKGITEANTTIATLPDGFRTSKKLIVAIASVGQMLSRLTIETSGEITYNRSTIEPVTADNYHSMTCVFSID